MRVSSHAESSAFTQALDAHKGLAWTRWHARALSQDSNMEATSHSGVDSETQPRGKYLSRGQTIGGLLLIKNGGLGDLRPEATEQLRVFVSTCLLINTRSPSKTIIRETTPLLVS